MPRETPSRWGLYAPFAALLIAVVVWTVVWAWMRGEVFRRMDTGARSLAELGFAADWRGRSVTGYPFRLDLEIVAPHLREQSGWGLSSPRLKAEAFVFAPGHWVIVAPSGVTVERRRGGPVLIDAKALRASLSEMNNHPPRVSVEGLGLKFSAPPGAAPVSIAGAQELHLHARSGPNDQGAFYLELDKAPTTGHGALSAIAAGAPVTLVIDAIYDHASALKGRGLAGALSGWSAAGGEARVRRFDLLAGAAEARASSGTLGLGPEGRLHGMLTLRLKGGPRLITALAGASGHAPEAGAAARAIVAAHDLGGAAAVTVHFQAGQTTLGPVAIGPAPRVY
jgi:hypothetical protein